MIYVTVFRYDVRTNKNANNGCPFCLAGLLCVGLDELVFGNEFTSETQYRYVLV